jgi:hypothetical protein
MGRLGGAASCCCPGARRAWRGSLLQSRTDWPGVRGHSPTLAQYWHTSLGTSCMPTSNLSYAGSSKSKLSSRCPRTTSYSCRGRGHGEAGAWAAAAAAAPPVRAPRLPGQLCSTMQPRLPGGVEGTGLPSAPCRHAAGGSCPGGARPQAGPAAAWVRIAFGRMVVEGCMRVPRVQRRPLAGTQQLVQTPALLAKRWPVQQAPHLREIAPETVSAPARALPAAARSTLLQLDAMDCAPDALRLLCCPCSKEAAHAEREPRTASKVERCTANQSCAWSAGGSGCTHRAVVTPHPPQGRPFPPAKPWAALFKPLPLTCDCNRSFLHTGDSP